MKPDSGALRHFGRIKNGTTPASGEAGYWDGDVLWATPEDLGKLTTDRISHTKRQITEKAVAECNLSVLPAGSVIISTRAPIGHMAINEIPMAFNQGCRGIIPGDQVDGPFLYYLLKSRAPALNAMANGTTFVELSRDELAAIPVEFPPLDTQRRIARFLDEKTARIDGLIEKKRALLDRLAEKRQALITRAVTKGLTPNTPMKPSGIYWLGEIPAHWDILPLKHVVRYQEGPGIMAVDFRDEGVPLLRIASVGSRYATLDGVNYLDPEMVFGKWSHFLTEIGNLLISASATSGIVSEITEETSGCIPYTGIIRINPIDGMATSDFVRHWLVSNVFLSQIDQLKAGSTIQHFGPYHLGLMVITKPPLCEQRAIGLELDQTLGNLEQNEARVSLSIQLLSEYRSAVVTAALTGQLLELG
ncbi:MAG: restriction endonuclease subunit S [Aphanocapsa feldmannii 277cV]|uniref:Restriction endonuclease subunit S n=1 Tax=Aphanocapsa feldmannii 277cV TaxID=2507553 RepID=A0A524RKK6_9CHRO|nr:MAG: restriction endonuclease subunit S [Aphanocapsa feldmannii 277cV]